MNRWTAFHQLLLARLREFFREWEVLFWVYGFPIVLAVGLGLAFASREPTPPSVDIVGPPALSKVQELSDILLANDFENVEVHTLEKAKTRLADGKCDLVIDATTKPITYIRDKNRSESVLAHRWVESVVLGEKVPDEEKPAIRAMEESGTRYIDFLIPGLMGLNLMGGGLWGVGFVTVDMRIRKLLKRMIATPMRKSDFLLAILTARLVFLIPDMGLLLLVGWFFFSVPIKGSLLLLLLAITVGAFCFSGIGILVACRATKTEVISGLMNLVMLPMWILSGSFFSASRFPDFMQPVIQALPLTQLNNALREIMLKSDTPLSTIAIRLAILLAWGVVGFLLGLRFFRWK
ncbi:MAG: ABC transporter permease [Gemmataceae bacterium]